MALLGELHQRHDDEQGVLDKFLTKKVELHKTSTDNPLLLVVILSKKAVQFETRLRNLWSTFQNPSTFNPGIFTIHMRHMQSCTLVYAVSSAFETVWSTSAKNSILYPEKIKTGITWKNMKDGRIVGVDEADPVQSNFKCLHHFLI